MDGLGVHDIFREGKRAAQPVLEVDQVRAAVSGGGDEGPHRGMGRRKQPVSPQRLERLEDKARLDN